MSTKTPAETDGALGAALVLPRPALTIVSAAVKAVRALERGGMELGR